MTFENILTETRGAVGIITLNRPKALNALCNALVAELNHALDGFEADAAVGAIILTGSEKAFAAGADIREMKDYSTRQARAEDFLKSWDHIGTIQKPLIAAVSGYALGGGFEFAMACDIILASETAKFALPEITLGILPGGGGTQRIAHAAGKSRAMELVLTGRMMDAAEAERLGIVSRVLPVAELLPEALKLGEKIAAMSQPAVRSAKRAVSLAFENSLQSGLKHERDIFYARFDSHDQKEGMTAFLEKREAQFTNS